MILLIIKEEIYASLSLKFEPAQCEFHMIKVKVKLYLSFKF